MGIRCTAAVAPGEVMRSKQPFSFWAAFILKSHGQRWLHSSTFNCDIKRRNEDLPKAVDLEWDQELDRELA
ncbi:hypothetical protein NDU88_004561 [Pleurodeles waltl]|uniref:Uncharacterized protein n=1 Tax=Pleurodeles waltl TaxID=8319 RepID=A0AAV7NK12_PLEWA|nr:hypothetical protein NDU88_004561 [Pleurodeles waltl]